MTKRFAKPTPPPIDAEAPMELAHTVSALKKMLVGSGLDRSKVDAMIDKAARSDAANRPGDVSRPRSSRQVA